METTTALVPTAAIDGALIARLVAYNEDAEGAFSPNTERLYRSATARWSSWCIEKGLPVVPSTPEAIAAWVDDLALELAPSSLSAYLSGIGRLHRAAGVDDPTRADKVRLRLRAIRRRAAQGGWSQKQATGLTRPLVVRLLAAASTDLRGLRDRAMIALGYDTFCRRAELVALRVEDLEIAADGTGTVTVRRSKTDQEGRGSVRFVARDTVGLVTAWLTSANIHNGPILRSVRKGGAAVGGPLIGGDVARILKELAQRAGLPTEGISAHGLRVGPAVDAVGANIEIASVMQSGGWSTPAMVARYTRKLDAKRSASARLAALQDRA
jgi:integrase